MKETAKTTYAGRIAQTGSQEVKAPAQIAPRKGKGVTRRVGDRKSKK